MQRYLFAILLNQPYEKVTISASTEEVTKATSAFGFDLYLSGKLQWKLSLDLSYTIKIHWKPKVLLEWEMRKRNWPINFQDLQEELSTCYVIAKPSIQDKNNPNSTEIRYSFAHIERKLITLQSSTQRLVYLIFKAMLYRWIIPINPNRISSYIGKTVMLWACEKYPPEKWDDSTSSIVEAVKNLLKELQKACQKGYLKYFFVPQINVIENIPQKTRTIIVKTIEKILSKISAYMPNNTEPLRRLLEKELSFLSYLRELKDGVIETGPTLLFTLFPDLALLLGKDSIQDFWEMQNYHNRMKKLKLNLYE